jgi:hypothetical protein
VEACYHIHCVTCNEVCRVDDANLDSRYRAVLFSVKHTSHELIAEDDMGKDKGDAEQT